MYRVTQKSLDAISYAKKSLYTLLNSHARLKTVIFLQKNVNHYGQMFAMTSVHDLRCCVCSLLYHSLFVCKIALSWQQY